LRCNENIVDVDYQVMVTEKNTGKFEQIRETHSMRYLFVPEILLIAGQTGMAVERTHEWMSERSAGLGTWYVVFELRSNGAELILPSKGMA
jgi:hypothetical protein